MDLGCQTRSAISVLKMLQFHLSTAQTCSFLFVSYHVHLTNVILLKQATKYNAMHGTATATLRNKVSAGLTTQCLSDCVYTCTSSCFTSCLCLNFLCIVFTVYANSVILNKTSVSGVRMIDYGSQARSPQWGKEACLTSAVNTISVLYECHQQSNDLLLGRVCSIFSPLLSLFLFPA